MQFAYIKDKFVDHKNAYVSINDRGFKFGDGVFETVRVSKSRPYKLDFHMIRLKMSLQAIKVQYIGFEKIRDLIYEIIARNSLSEGFVEVQITRGESSIEYLPLTSETNLYIQTSALDDSKIKHLYHEGIKLHISKYESISSKALPRKYKILQGLNPTLARLEAIENGCFESILLNQEQYISDCSSSNIFAIKGEEILTPDLESGTIYGCIRHTILSKLSNFFQIKETQLTLSDLARADAVFVTNIYWLLLEVNEIPILAKEYQESEIIKQIRQVVNEDLEYVDA